MKKVNLKGKLSLGKETISKLNSVQLNGIKGGAKPVSENGCVDTQVFSECRICSDESWRVCNTTIE
jgi:hypothetical protein